MRKTIVFISILLLLSLMVSSTTAQDDLCNVELEVMTTDAGVDFVRTPDACFENLPDWPYEPQYVEINGLRQAYVDVGTGESGETILLLHGEPTWGYLYRHMIPVLADAGHRVIAMDHLGLGRSDKPIDIDYYSFQDHVERLETFITELELEQGNLTIFSQDWGHVIGMYVVGTNPEWFDRVVAGNGILPFLPASADSIPYAEDIEASNAAYHESLLATPDQQPAYYDEDGNLIVEQYGGSNDGWAAWMTYAMFYEDLDIGQFVEVHTYFPISAEEEAAYSAPFPSEITMAGARSFPSLVNDTFGVTLEAWANLREFEKPFLTIWGGNDPNNAGLPRNQNLYINSVPGAEGWDHVRLPEAGHYLQDDQGEDIARRMNEFIAQTPITEAASEAGEALIGLREATIPAIEQTQFMPQPDDLRDFRYCEVLTVVPGDDGFRVSAFNSMGQSDCPSDQWADLDADAISDAYGLLGAVLNGPRYWVVNNIVSPSGLSSSGQISEFNGMEMRLVAQINTTPDQVASMGFAPYSEAEVVRDTVYTYSAGSRVYELVSPEGDIYRMQSYSQEVDPTLTINDLENLGERLNLPEGWSFQTRILEEDRLLTADGIAHLVSDELNNAYQRVNEPITEGQSAETAEGASDQPGYRAGLYPTNFPTERKNLNGTHELQNTGFPPDITADDLEMEIIEMPYPALMYTRESDELFIIGGMPFGIDRYVSLMDGLPTGQNETTPYLAKYNTRTRELTYIDLDQGTTIPYLGGALMHANGYVYAVAQSHLYKVEPASMTVESSVALPAASPATIYNGLLTSSTGELILKSLSFAGGESEILLIDPDTLEITFSTPCACASPRLSLAVDENGVEHLYHLNREQTFRYVIEPGLLTLDPNWIASFDPDGTGVNQEPTSPVIVDGRVYYTTNTNLDAELPMRVFWQDVNANYAPDMPPLTGPLLFEGVEDVPGWSFSGISADEASGIFIGVDQANGLINAFQPDESGDIEILWQHEQIIGSGINIVSDRGLVYANDYVDGSLHLVVRDLFTGEEVLRVPTPATRASLGSIVSTENGDIYMAANEPGQPTGFLLRLYIP
jgi:pimeloyl-ACP methyl ester carboxylesterase